MPSGNNDVIAGQMTLSMMKINAVQQLFDQNYMFDSHSPFGDTHVTCGKSTYIKTHIFFFAVHDVLMRISGDLFKFIVSTGPRAVWAFPFRNLS